MQESVIRQRVMENLASSSSQQSPEELVQGDGFGSQAGQPGGYSSGIGEAERTKEFGHHLVSPDTTRIVYVSRVEVFGFLEAVARDFMLIIWTSRTSRNTDILLHDMEERGLLTRRFFQTHDIERWCQSECVAHKTTREGARGGELYLKSFARSIVRPTEIDRGRPQGRSRSRSTPVDPDRLYSRPRSIEVDLKVLESQQKTCEDLTYHLVEAGATIAAREVELKQKEEEIAALKERLQASEQKLQRKEAKNAWLHEVTSTLTSEIQSLRSERTKVKLTEKVPDWD
ncbi:hypothetical protein R1flu_015811 [Riccia fluitans]|uniref:Uncharacterized protein n=1 Tax=Riccia fluitans TaxID=41844 RepID=A0ABD1YKE3_9MARC